MRARLVNAWNINPKTNSSLLTSGRLSTIPESQDREERRTPTNDSTLPKDAQAASLKV